jgi:FdhD protein
MTASANIDGKRRRPGPTVRTQVVEARDGQVTRHEDRLATEEPLEIRLAWPGGLAERISVTMRTPGHDFELAVGWLAHERIITRDQIAAVAYCADVDLDPVEEFNVVTVTISSPPHHLPAARMVNSACGVCGTTSIKDAMRDVTPVVPRFIIDLATARALPDLLRDHQPGFDRTGGLHAAGLFGPNGELEVVREDVGRHNAVDKVVGSRLLRDEVVPPVLVLSGRIGFELVQKAAVSGVEAIVAVGAPTSLAVSLAAEAGIGMAGFTKESRCVVYACRERFGL